MARDDFLACSSCGRGRTFSVVLYSLVSTFLPRPGAVSFAPAVLAVYVAVAAKTSHFAILVADATPGVDVFIGING